MCEKIGLYYLPEILTDQLQNELLNWIKSDKIQQKFVPAFGKYGRVVCQFGWDYQYSSRSVKRSKNPIPDILKKSVIEIADYFLEPDEDEDEEDYYFNQVIINEYKEGELITAHTDLYKFGDNICCFTLNTPATMVFRRKKGNGPDKLEIVVKPGSAYLMSGESRSNYTHEMKKTNGIRWSITLRRVDM